MTKKIAYSHRLRPTGHATLPAGVTFELIAAPWEIAHLRPDLPRTPYRHGMFVTNRPLTPTECEQYEILVHGMTF